MTVFSTLPEISLKYKASTITEQKIQSSRDLFDLMKGMFDADTVEYREEVIIMFLNNANQPIGWMKHSAGGTAHTIIDVKMILVSALKAGAQCVTIAHNHPSGQNFPSREDEKITEKVKIGCEAVGLRLLDHIIIASIYNQAYYSFVDEGKL
jgi:DNA repair protein RadC